MSLSSAVAPVAISVIMLTACLGDRGVAPVLQSPETTLSRIVVSPTSAILAVGGTDQLQVTGYSLTGAVTSLDSVLYRIESLSDTALVRIDHDGTITAVAPSSRTIHVDVFGYQGTVLTVDRLLLQVTSQPISGLTLSIQPPPGDSAVLVAGARRFINPVLRNPITGEEALDPPMRYRVKPQDVSALTVFQPRIYSPGFFLVQQLGVPTVGEKEIAAKDGGHRVWVYADVSAYGTLLRDSVLYSSIYPLSYSFNAFTVQGAIVVNDPGGRTTHRTATLAPGATVTFRSGVDSSHVSYTFAGPEPPAPAVPPSTVGGSSGDVVGLEFLQTSRRRFVVPGTYTWTMKVTDGPAPWNGQTVTGQIVIK
jgi:hypothetical protein